MVIPDTQLTEEEARVLFTALANTWAINSGYAPFQSGVKKLGILGRGFACRDCTEIGTKSSRFGGFVCPRHKQREDALVEEGKIK